MSIKPTAQQKAKPIYTAQDHAHRLAMPLRLRQAGYGSAGFGIDGNSILIVGLVTGGIRTESCASRGWPLFYALNFVFSKKDNLDAFALMAKILISNQICYIFTF